MATKSKKDISKTADKRLSYLLIDGEGLLHQSFHKFNRFTAPDGTPTGAVFGFFKSLHHYMYRFKPDDMYIVFDNGHSKYRKDILPTYKAHRKNISVDYESLQNQKKQIMQLLRYLRIKYIYDKHKLCNYEGDDFLAYLTLKYLPRKSKITLITSDKDFNQLLRGQTVKIYNMRKDQIVMELNCEALFGYKAKDTVDYLTLVGDSSDDIPGYPGIGDKKAKIFLEQFGSIQNYLDGDECLKGDEGHKKMLEVRDKNRALIDLKWFVNQYPLKPEDLPVKTYKSKKLKMLKFKEFAVANSISSFLNKMFLQNWEEQIIRSYGKDE